MEPWTSLSLRRWCQSSESFWLDKSWPQCTIISMPIKMATFAMKSSSPLWDKTWMRRDLQSWSTHGRISKRQDQAESLSENCAKSTVLSLIPEFSLERRSRRQSITTLRTWLALELKVVKWQRAGSWSTMQISMLLSQQRRTTILWIWFSRLGESAAT